jgi:processing peptidase subunit alpha
MLEKIDEVTLPDLQRVARRIFRPTRSSDALRPGEQRSGEPTILAIGQIDRLGDVRDVLRRYGLTP